MKRLPIDPVLKQVSCPRERSPKKKFRRCAKAFVENIAKRCFGFRYKSIIVRNRPRKAELAYKLRVVGKNTSAMLSLFNSEVYNKTEHYTLQFSGSFNPRTGKEELYIDLVLFGDIDNPVEGIIHEKSPVSERSYGECAPFATQ